MPSVRVSELSDLPPQVVLTAARDLSDRRAELWPDVHVEHPEAHEIGDTYAEVTEGNPWPIGYVWERSRYDWSGTCAAADGCSPRSFPSVPPPPPCASIFATSWPGSNRPPDG